MSVPRMRRRAAVGLAALAATAFTAVAVNPNQAAAGPKPVDVKLLAINDFHGNLEPPTGSSGTIDGKTAGGAEYLAQLPKPEEEAGRIGRWRAVTDVLLPQPARDDRRRRGCSVLSPRRGRHLCHAASSQ